MRKIEVYKNNHRKYHKLSDYVVNDYYEILPKYCNVLNIIKYSKEDLPLKYR